MFLRAARRLAALLVALGCCAAAVQAQEPALEPSLGEFVSMVPGGGFTEPRLEVTVFKPAGDGPFPVVLINHGRAAGDARFQARYRPLWAAREFVQRGYAVVVPMRQGFSKSGGTDIIGGCHVGANGEGQAKSVRRTLDWVATQPWADVSRNIVMGQSHGGLTTLAYGMQPHPGTRLLVNFAGGLRQEQCPNWEQALVSAIASYGAETALPSLWFYGDNDSFFSPEVFRAAYQGYVAKGGKAELVAYGRFGTDSHAMFGSRAGLPIWVPKVMAAIAALGLPTDKRTLISPPGDLPAPQASGYAALDQVDKLPTTSTRALAGYQSYLAADPPKAFAIHPGNGSWASASGSNKPLSRALDACAKLAKVRPQAAPPPPEGDGSTGKAGSTQEACRLYAVDDTVVWRNEP